MCEFPPDVVEQHHMSVLVNIRVKDHGSSFPDLALKHFVRSTIQDYFSQLELGLNLAIPA